MSIVSVKRLSLQEWKEFVEMNYNKRTPIGWIMDEVEYFEGGDVDIETDNNNMQSFIIKGDNGYKEVSIEDIRMSEWILSNEIKSGDKVKEGGEE